MAISEGLFVSINGVHQWVTIRGSDLANPVVLLLSGPGVALSRMAPLFEPWEKYFTLVQWDQPGAGATQLKNGDATMGPLTLNRITRDAIAVTEFACQWLEVHKIIVVGTSGGSIIGLKMMKERPELFSAFVGTGQIVSASRQSAIKAETPTALTPAEQAALANMPPPPADATYLAKGFAEYDQRAFAMAAYLKLRNEITSFEAREMGSKFEVPLFFFQGDRDSSTITSEVEAWLAEIEAPQKTIATIEGGGHACIFLADQFLALFNTHVRK